MIYIIEVFNDNRLNTIIGCICNRIYNYLYPSAIRKTRKNGIVLMGEFNINLLQSDVDTKASNFMIIFTETLFS